jgi:ketosteroid isomerase-like protein
MPDPTAELLQLSERLLTAIVNADWTTYAQLCDPDLTAFEPEGVGHRIEGLAFHRYYFDLNRVHGSRNTSICEPKVRLMGDVAVVTYVRLEQHPGKDNVPVTSAHEETRVWQRRDGLWKLVHFHRSPAPA